MIQLEKREITVSSKGQISLPIDIRRALDIRTGDRLALEARADGSITLRRQNVGDFESLIGRWRNSPEEPLDIDQIMEELRGPVEA